MLEGILIGSVGLAAFALLSWLVAVMVRLWRTPKRLDRLEAIVPPLARGVWALLGEHVREHNGDTPEEIAKVYEELTTVVTDGVVSPHE